MLTRLRHDAFIGGNHQDGRVDPAHTGEHVLDEINMAGHVDDANARRLPGHIRGRKLHPGKAQIDGHSALFFFF